MNTFPLTDWLEPCLTFNEAGDCTEYDYVAYFTWADSSAAGVILTILGITISVVMAMMITARENKLLNDAADRLADKYSSEG